jgi:hypothetical protein
MARKLRIEFPDAIYHVLNRGNYRRDLFTSSGEAGAFVSALEAEQNGVRPIFVDFWFDSDLGLEIFCSWRENFGSNFLTRFIMC